MGSLQKAHSTGLPGALLIGESVRPHTHFGSEVEEALQISTYIHTYMHEYM